MNKQWNRPLQSTRPQVQKEGMKMWKELRTGIERNAGHHKNKQTKKN